MEIVLFDQKNRDEWEHFSECSSDAWFWHTTDWMTYTQEYSKEGFLANSSFFVIENSEILAICPVMVERSALPNDIIQFSYSGGPIPFPAMHDDLTPGSRQRVLKFYVQALRFISKKENVSYVSVKVPSVANNFINYEMPFANPLIKFGFIELTYHTQVINLQQELDDLWAGIRKGHRYDIRRSEKVCELRVWDQHTITAEKFSEYQLLHQKDAGRITRSQRTFDLMLSWIKQGNAILVEAEHDGRAIGFALLILFQRGAFYGSSCKDPDYYETPASHLIQWATIRWLREHQFEWYDIGIQQFFPQWFDPASTKDISISFFKRGFGGVTIPLPTAEYFYSKSCLEQTYKERLQRYLSLV